MQQKQLQLKEHQERNRLRHCQSPKEQHGLLTERCTLPPGAVRHVRGLGTSPNPWAYRLIATWVIFVFSHCQSELPRVKTPLEIILQFHGANGELIFSTEFIR